MSLAADNKCRHAAVRPGPKIDGYRVIRKGLTGDETIVINGIVRVRPGVKVAPAADGAAAGAGTQRLLKPPGLDELDEILRISSSIGRSLRRCYRSCCCSSAASPTEPAGRPISRDRAADHRGARAAIPGADAETVAATVATPIEQEINGVEDMLYMSSYSTSDGAMSLTITFKLGTDLDQAQVLVQNRVADRRRRACRRKCARLGVTTLKSSPDLMMVVHMLSPDDTYDQLYVSNYARNSVRDVLLRLDGVGDLIIFGERAIFACASGSIPKSSSAFGMTVRRRGARRAGAERPGLGRLARARSRRRADNAFQLVGHHAGPLRGSTPVPRVIVDRPDDGRLVRCRTWRASSSARRTTSPTPISTASRRWRWRSSSGPAPMRSPPPRRSSSR